METAALVAPVTALEFLQDTLLLTGEGPVLTVYSLHPQPKACSSMPVLQQHRIHGIRHRVRSDVSPKSSYTDNCRESRGLSSLPEPNYYDLAVFGGKAVRRVRLHLNVSALVPVQLEIQSPVVQLQDWVLDVRWLCKDKESLLCVAVAHNGALLLDISSGRVLAQRSCLEGCLLYSALLVVHKSWEDTVLVGGTVFNQLILWKPGGKESNNKASVERRLLGHTGVIFSISYLQEKGWLASASDDRSVRMWSVGVLGGSGGNCGGLNPTCIRVLFGHQARVFSVCLSSRRLFSAGEDGACLIWNWAGVGTVLRSLKGHRAGGIRALAVSAGRNDAGRWVATGGADGGVRLWKDEENKEEDTGTKTITDLEFSGQGMPKVVCVVEGKAHNTNWRQCSILVCTDQGIVYHYVDGYWELVWQGSPEFQSYCVMETVCVRVKDSTSKANICAVGSLSGDLNVFHVDYPQHGIVLQAGAGKIHSLTWQKGDDYLYLLASGAEGRVYRWCIEVRLNEIGTLDFNVKICPPFVLPTCAKRWLTAAVRLHPKPKGTLWVCGDRRGSLLLFLEDEDETNKSMQESKKAHKNDRTMKERSEGHNGLMLSPVNCLFGVHGKQGVTSICEYQGLLYSTGRDGCVRVFRVHYTPDVKLEGSGKGNLQLDVLRVQRACKGMEWLERVLFIQPTSYADNGVTKEFESENMIYESMTERLEDQEEGLKQENKRTEARFVIFGFHANQFVVWDPVRQERQLEVPCGGGHRSWSFWPIHSRVWSGYGALVYIKQGSVLSSEPPLKSPSWSGSAARNEGWNLREGIHGRGIGCVCRLGSIWVQKDSTANIIGISGSDGVQIEGQWEIIVTGGEDTSLTVLAVHPNSGTVTVLSVITDHISSVRTITALTHQDSQSLSALVISASGRAQLQCYRLWVGWDKQRLPPVCQVVQVASHRLDEHWERRRNRHKMVKMDPETRYMSMAVVDHNSDAVLVALACSDGAVRLFSVSEQKRQIDLLWETFYHQRCVLSVATCSLQDGKGNRCVLLFSAATDGKIAVWDLTHTASALFYGPPSGASTPPTPCLTIAAHQSGVNSLGVWAETQGHQDGSCLVTVPSGGDDGQLTVSTIRLEYGGRTGGFTQDQPQTHLSLQLISQLTIPLAHAAPLTALKLLKPGLIVTTSCDQRVCLWELCSTTINHRGVLCSHVADAAGLAVWQEEMVMVENRRKKTRSEADMGVVDGRTESKTFLETTEWEAEALGYKDQKVASAENTNNSIETIEQEKDRGNEMQTDDQAGDEPVTESAMRLFCEKKEERKLTGWVLVCGQGFQLLRIRNADNDEGAYIHERRNTE
ncbi:WD repeat-containing protein 6 [Corythoichthys intestinalis]|uniref:WD repeat-containing protein 6 n=1 Tax=Corythoichthys intestinalis TaxID=161448 RepID=UPI0025A541A5|nr:WD repeat-containing protein 6 [Corythoichthys intestinalis]XP_057685936.1 WD repeat-containing protein 6 [Corythoichthys intestinalis]XP_057685937.1 WD repeat-containing protein 6 [Corythoichthys intestinalis]XP_061802763.1 tRNA (34-2'-O)-methyltransferase regulator WDR6-like [Nerophis lumbriciformis]